VSRLPELTAKVDAFFSSVQERHGDDMQCGTGCSDCCHVRLTVTAVEAAAIRALARRVTPNADPAKCAALDELGRCQIYEARPIVCRSHGAPIRMRPVRMRIDSLPVIQSCFRNFRHTDPPAGSVFDQETLSAILLAVDRDAGGDGSRVDLAALLASC